MSPIAWAAVSALILACAHRERGQDHSWIGTTGARVLFWAVPVGAIVFAIPAPPNPAGLWTAVLAGAAAYAGMAWLPHGVGQNLSETPADYPNSWTACVPLLEKLGYLAAVGIARKALIALPLTPDHPAALWLPLAGLSMPLAYLLGTKLPALPWRLTRPTEWGELLTGAGFGAALGIVLTV
ncbi:hypothetical protein [Azospirillum picis]|uniref:Uncharacterized protein n=1 Tax=Azospirillum picis TaxID=488438 RepID=A0ABU0MEB7_9PROT|nr:hypothetical protein [Azospirillum picis]MBP2297942.1 hypothetical protein [Azospirillum picis]MDQ0531780.1 hypothetical protein [Azospirillum picis]